MLEVLTLVHMASSEHYSIKQVSEMSGLPSSTLRYYESIGIIPVISRDSSSKQRVYSEDDLGFIKNVACLYGLGLSITDMRDYLTNMAGATPVHAHNQVALLQRQAETLEEEAALLESRRRYVAAKVAYWQAVEAGDQETLASADEESRRRSADLRQAIHTMSKRKDNEDSDI
ncbi:hypothetical protein GCM10009615_09720 [Corynebacterium durum]